MLVETSGSAIIVIINSSSLHSLVHGGNQFSPIVENIFFANLAACLLVLWLCWLHVCLNFTVLLIYFTLQKSTCTVHYTVHYYNKICNILLDTILYTTLLTLLNIKFTFPAYKIDKNPDNLCLNDYIF